MSCYFPLAVLVVVCLIHVHWIPVVHITLTDLKSGHKSLSAVCMISLHDGHDVSLYLFPLTYTHSLPLLFNERKSNHLFDRLLLLLVLSDSGTDSISES